jgi:carbamoyl-phosphate synthase large subunit
MEQQAFVPAVMEHIELAGIHPEILPVLFLSIHVTEENLNKIKEYTRKIAVEMNVTRTHEYAVCHRK